MTYIRITKSVSGISFPYGILSDDNKRFVEDFVDVVFPAEQVNMNYYKLRNGMLVHVYNAFETNENK